MLAKLTLFSVILVTAVCSNVCGWSDEVLRLDMRDGCCSDHSYFVVFVARRCSATGPGHSFVVWTELDHSGLTLSTTACGYYPQIASPLGCLIPQSGCVVDELTRKDSLDATLWTQRLVVRVNRELYRAALAQKERWINSNQHFNILSHNCTHFTHDVACAIGLRLPGPVAAEFPPDYMSRLLRIVCCRVHRNEPTQGDDTQNRDGCVVSVDTSTMTQASHEPTCSESDSACSAQ